MSITAILGLVGATAAILPQLSGLFGKVAIFGKLKERILGNPKSTIAGAGVGLTVPAIMEVFGCKVPLDAWQTWLPALLPLLVGALSGDVTKKAPPAVSPPTGPSSPI